MANLKKLGSNRHFSKLAQHLQIVYKEFTRNERNLKSEKGERKSWLKEISMLKLFECGRRKTFPI
jgi:hypothetical protein